MISKPSDAATTETGSRVSGSAYVTLMVPCCHWIKSIGPRYAGPCFAVYCLACRPRGSRRQPHHDIRSFKTRELWWCGQPRRYKDTHAIDDRLPWNGAILFQGRPYLGRGGVLPRSGQAQNGEHTNKHQKSLHRAPCAFSSANRLFRKSPVRVSTVRIHCSAVSGMVSPLCCWLSVPRPASLS